MLGINIERCWARMSARVGEEGSEELIERRREVQKRGGEP